MKNRLLRILLYFVAALFCLPVIYVVFASFLGEDGFGLWQYRTLFHSYPSYFAALKNSFFYAGAITAGGLFFSIPVSYLFARLEFRGRNTLFFSYVVVMMLPVQSTILGQYLLMQDLGWLGQRQAVALPLMLSPMTVFLLRQNIKTVSGALIDSVRLETNSIFVLWFRIVLPQIKSILIAATVLLFCDSWNIVEQAMLLLPKNDEAKPLSVMMERYPMEIRPACETIYLAPVGAVLLFLLVSWIWQARHQKHETQDKRKVIRNR